MLKSGTDFECFTNLTVLFGVTKPDFESFVEQAKTKGNLRSNYCEKNSRMYIREKVSITSEFQID